MESFFCTYLLGAPVLTANILAVLQHLEDFLDGGLLFLELLHLQRLATSPGLLDELLQRLLGELDILETKLLADDVQITDRVDITLNVDDLGIIEASHHLEDGIDSANVRQESVSKTGTGGSALCETGDVVDGQVGRHDRLGLVVLDEPVEAVIGDNDTRLFGVDCGIGKVLHWSMRVRNGRVERLTAGLPRWHFVIAWNRVDLPTFARPTWRLLLT